LLGRSGSGKQSDMSVIIEGRYLAGKKVELKHQPSGTRITTAAPKDNQGDGSSFSPTDLVAAALGGCMVTLMAIAAEKNNFELGPVEIQVEKIMGGPPRRIAELKVAIQLSAAHVPDSRHILEQAALSCPVHKSLHPETKIPVEFSYLEQQLSK
jgi:uncharacterized OsmC-like protein